MFERGRFRVQMDWATSDGRTGAAVTGTADTGMFRFFSPNNIEAIVKAVNGCSFNRSYRVFGGVDERRDEPSCDGDTEWRHPTYANPQGMPFQPVQDAAAFATCP